MPDKEDKATALMSQERANVSGQSPVQTGVLSPEMTGPGRPGRQLEARRLEAPRPWPHVGAQQELCTPPLPLLLRASLQHVSVFQG